jgi:hypothetical protein
MHLFIDANIFLFFYQYSKDDLEELDKLRVLLRKGEITLWLPDQVREELRRKREIVIAAALKDLKEQKLSFAFPAMSKGYTEHETLRQLQRDYGKHHSALIEQITADACNSNLKADKTIRSLIDLAKPIEISDAIYQRAERRHARGNPPGKAASLGDAINWEALLAAVPRSEALHFITDDNDYASLLVKDRFHPFLAHDWTRAKASELHYYRSLSSFLHTKYPDIHFAPELEKTLAIRDFVASRNFSQTHASVAALRRFAEFTTSELNDIVNAAISNNQIAWIITDIDVKSFLTKAISGKEDKIDPDSLADLQTLLTPQEVGTVAEDPQPDPQ